MDVFDLANSHVHLLAFIHRQPDVDQVVFVGHGADLHEGQEFTFVVATLILYNLEKKKKKQDFSEEMETVSIPKTGNILWLRITIMLNFRRHNM